MEADGSIIRVPWYDVCRFYRTPNNSLYISFFDRNLQLWQSEYHARACTGYMDEYLSVM